MIQLGSTPLTGVQTFVPIAWQNLFGYWCPQHQIGFRCTIGPCLWILKVASIPPTSSNLVGCKICRLCFWILKLTYRPSLPALPLHAPSNKQRLLMSQSHLKICIRFCMQASASITCSRSIQESRAPKKVVKGIRFKMLGGLDLADTIRLYCLLNIISVKSSLWWCLPEDPYTCLLDAGKRIVQDIIHLCEGLQEHHLRAG